MGCARDIKWYEIGGLVEMTEQYDRIYWLLDCRFDFLLPSFERTFGIKLDDIIFVNSYHGNARQGYRTVTISAAVPVSMSAKEGNSVWLMEPDEINCAFAETLEPCGRNLAVSFSGAGLPQSDHLITLTAAGEVAGMCNDKWWQYHFFRQCGLPTPATYEYHTLEEVERECASLLERHQRIVLKKARLSGGYLMKVLTREADLEEYRQNFDGAGANGRYLVSAYIPHQRSLAGMGIVQKDGSVTFIGTTQQVLYEEVVYEGLIFPTFLDADGEAEIARITTDIGKGLWRYGYYGFFNADFIQQEDRFYVIEINVRFGFGTILAACLYGDDFWKVLCGSGSDPMRYEGKRLAIGKVKGRQGRTYCGLRSHSNITVWFRSQEGEFETFFCGTGEPELFEYGSYIGVFGLFFEQGESEERILHKLKSTGVKLYV